MHLPVYFVQPPGENTPHLAACGWHTDAGGGLCAPAAEGRARVLVFDDRASVPERCDALAARLVQAAKERGAETVVLDFERPPSPAACALTAALSAQLAVCAPEAFCAGTSAIPLFCYEPRRETAASFLARVRGRNGWLELRPVDDTLTYPAAGVAEEAGGDFFCEALQCRCAAQCGPGLLRLRLFDTPESFRTRWERFAPDFSAAIGLRTELEAFGLTG